MAEAPLKKIRIKDLVNADKLEEARVCVPDPSPKFCSQSKAMWCERLDKEFGGTGLPTPTIMQRSDYEAEIEDYIEKCFKAWKWHSGVLVWTEEVPFYPAQKDGQKQNNEKTITL